MSIPRTILFALALIGIGFVLTSPCQADKTAEPAKPVALKEESKRRVYVLHSGVHTILSESHKNIAAERIREGLENDSRLDQEQGVDRGIAAVTVEHGVEIER